MFRLVLDATDANQGQFTVDTSEVSAIEEFALAGLLGKLPGVIDTAPRLSSRVTVTITSRQITLALDESTLVDDAQRSLVAGRLLAVAQAAVQSLLVGGE